MSVPRGTRLSERQAAELERLRLLDDQRHIVSFVPTITPKFRSPGHLAAFADAIEASRREPTFRLVSTPPRHGKTELILHACAWLLKQDPSKTIGYMTYSGDLAKSKSRRARRMALAAGVRLAKGSKAVHEWRTAEGGGMLAAGLSGTWSGHGVDYAFIDDPYKGRMEAESQLIRDRVWDWFINVGYPRLEPGGSAYVVHTRWHEDDLTGRLEHHPEAPWQKLILPAIAREGEPDEAPLWPDRFSLEKLKQIRGTIGPYAWASLYQGTPTDKSGAVFKLDWFRNNTIDIFPSHPGALEAFAGVKTSPWDYTVVAIDGAWSTGVGADYSAMEVWSRKGNLYFLRDVARGRWEFPDLLRRAVDIFNGAEANALLIEASASGLALLPVLKRETAIPCIGVSVNQSKTTRAEAVAPLIETGRCKFLRGSKFLGAYIAELCAFPNGSHDDQVDATSLALQHFMDKSRGFGFDLDRRDQGVFDRDIYALRWR